MITRNPQASTVRARAWRATFYLLFVAMVGAGVLNVLRIRGGFLTNHLADLTIPAWLYIASRGLHTQHPRRTLIRRTIGRSAEFAAVSLFAASAATEVSQFFWPHGTFPGRFDPLDLVAYAAGLLACYAAERRFPLAPEPGGLPR
jgi:hypothetical protein